jgi:hypothetical protein
LTRFVVKSFARNSKGTASDIPGCGDASDVSNDRWYLCVPSSTTNAHMPFSVTTKKHLTSRTCVGLRVRLTADLPFPVAAARVERTRIGDFIASKVPSFQEFAEEEEGEVLGDDGLVGLREAMTFLQG